MFTRSLQIRTTRAVNLNGSSIYLLGFKETLMDQTSGHDLTSHIMVDSNGQVIFSNLQ